MGKDKQGWDGKMVQTGSDGHLTKMKENSKTIWKLTTL